MSSRARGACRGRRSCLSRQEIGPEIGHGAKAEVVTFGKPDKMTSRNPDQGPAGDIAGLRHRFRGEPPGPSAMVECARNAIGLGAFCCLVVVKVLSLRRDADNAHLTPRPLLEWSG